MSGALTERAAAAALDAAPITLERPVPRPTLQCFAMVLAVVLTLGIGMRVAYVRSSEVILDEFEHVHAAYLVSQGQTPYRDFFEHHTPLFYYLAAAVVPMDHPTFDTLIRVRYLALAFAGLTVALAAWWVKRLVGDIEAVVVACLLMGNFFLFAWGTLTYLDTYAAACLLGCAAALTNSRERPFRCLVSGAALGVAILFTQKALCAAIAPACVFLLRGIHEGPIATRRRVWLRDLAGFAVGLVAAALLVPALLGFRTLGAFVHDNVTLNMGWRARRFPAKELLILGGTDGFIYGLAAIGLGRQGCALIRRRFQVDDADLPALFLVALTAGIVVLPVVWEEYFILLVPFAVIVAGLTLVDWCRRYLCVGNRLGFHANGHSRWVSALLLGLFGVMGADLVGRVVGPHRLSTAAVTEVVVLWTAITLLIVLVGRWRPAWQPALWLVLVLAFPIVEQRDWIGHSSNDAQRQRVAFILTHTTPQDAVFDGYSGFGVFRPHAFRYWFLHEEVQAMLSEQEKNGELIEALQRVQPRIVIRDQYIDALPAAVRTYLDTHYEGTPFPDIKIRKDLTHIIRPPGASPAADSAPRHGTPASGRES